VKRPANVVHVALTIAIAIAVASCSDDGVTEPVKRSLSWQMVSPLDGAVFERGDTVSVVVETNNADDLVRYVQFSIDGKAVHWDITPPFRLDWPTLDERLGGHTLQAIVRDANNDSTAHSVDIELVYRYRVPPNTGDGWETASLESVGMEHEGFKALMDKLGRSTSHLVHGILIVRHGKLVFEEYFAGLTHPTFGETPVYFDRDRLHVSSSVTKSFASALLGIAIEQGMISSVDDKVLDFYPELADLRVGWKPDISLRHLVTMASGLDWDEHSLPLTDPSNDLRQFLDLALYTDTSLVRVVFGKTMVTAPGRLFNYGGGCTNVIGNVVQRASGLRLDEFADTYLFDALGIENRWWWLLRPDFVYASGDLALRPRDMARFGQLFLQNGRWNGEQIVSEEWVQLSATTVFPIRETQADSQVGYSFGWWPVVDLYGQGAYAAKGWGGQEIIVMPEYDMVAVFTGGSYWRPPLLNPHRMMVLHVLPSIAQAGHARP
jgi:CubicO group peptidase (beta-lactamase class C family)